MVVGRSVVAWTLGAACAGCVAFAASGGLDAASGGLDAGPEDGADGAPASTCDGGCPPVVLARSQSQPYALTVFEGDVYWTNSGADGSVVRCATTGCASPEVIASGQPQPYALSLAGGQVYWTNLGDGSLYAAPLDGGAAVAQITPMCASQGPNPTSLVVTGGPTLNWTSAQRAGEVSTCTLPNCNNDGACGSWFLVTGQGVASALAVDSTALYWINTVAGGQIVRCGVTDYCANVPHVVAAAPGARALAIDDVRAYFAGAQGIYAAPKDGAPDGGAGDVLAANVSNVSAIVAEPGGAHLYVTTLGTGAGDGSVLEVSKADGGTTPIATGQRSPKAIAIDDGFVYWTCSDEGTVKRAPKPGR